MDNERPGNIWFAWYAWYPVLPRDDTLSWLEIVYRRRGSNGHWEYRTLRPADERHLAQACIPISTGA
ncbi:hypothetical protein R6X40_26245 [Rhizobium sp. PL01]|nr:hypothetical protein [Rhizobium sp. PL01]MDW5317566.1 hypothetical protein [Rhizobium sp. PL01]